MEHDPPFDVQVESRNGVVRMTLVGELDMLSVPALQKEVSGVDESRVSAIVLDLRDLTFVDSTGLQTFLKMWDRAEANGHKLLLVGVRDSAKRLFEVSGTEFLMDGQDPVGVLEQFTRTPAARGGAESGQTADE